MSATPFAIEAAACTHMGHVRDHNEDCHALHPERALFILADGMGGHLAGEVASALAVETIGHSVLASADHPDSIAPDDMLLHALLAAHHAIRAAAEADLERRGMGTTTVVVWIPPPGDIAWIAHVGDSRAYLWRAGQLRPLTEDHTILNQLRRAGVLPPDPEQWPPRSVLSQSLGARPVIAPDVNQLALQADDVLLLCSDGLTDMLSEAEVAEQLSASATPADAARALVEAANVHGGRDNITAIVLRFARNAIR
jgi:serine/threonine protein phosphatase PrpC